MHSGAGTQAFPQGQGDRVLSAPDLCSGRPLFHFPKGIFQISVMWGTEHPKSCPYLFSSHTKRQTTPLPSPFWPGVCDLNFLSLGISCLPVPLVWVHSSWALWQKAGRQLVALLGRDKDGSQHKGGTGEGKGEPQFHGPCLSHRGSPSPSRGGWRLGDPTCCLCTQVGAAPP